MSKKRTISKKTTKKKAGPKVVTMKVSNLVKAEYNPRVISDEALAGLTESVRRFGLVEPIIVNVRGGINRIVGGHQRVRALGVDPGQECLCITVNLSPADEKILNLALNNPQTQGKFIEGLDGYIDQLRAEISDDDIESLRIAELQGAMTGISQPMQRRKINLKPYDQSHVLLSFPPAKFAEIQTHLEAILKVEGVEYAQSAN